MNSFILEKDETPSSIYQGYPFVEDWEKSMCKHIIKEAMAWGDKQDEQTKESKEQEMFLYFKRYNSF